jgi:cytoskeletal protein CcmA (bactofilin family)
VSAAQDKSRKDKDNVQHLDEMTCMLYIERQLDRARGQEVSAHTQDCAACRTLLRALERESRLLTRAMLEEDEALPARLETFQERARRSMQWIWGVVFGLAATGAYAVYTGYVEPWQQRLDQAGIGSSNLLSLLIFQGAFWKGWQSMVTLLEVLAMVTLAGLCAMFFRKRIRRGSALALIFAGLCAMLAVPAPGMATETRKGETVEVKSGETIHGDIFLFGTRIRVDGTVDGDVFAFSSDVNINGHVKGDVIAFSQSLRISGQVDGNVRNFSNNVTVTGVVEKNLLTFDETTTLDPAGQVKGSLTGFSKALNLDGKLGKDLYSFQDHVEITGSVGGNVDCRGSSMTIGSTGVVSGKVKFEGHMAPDVSAGAKLASPPEYTHTEQKHEYRDGGYYMWQTIWLAAYVLFGLVLMLVLPDFSREAIGGLERYGASLGVGVLVLFGVPIASLLACITVVGLFVGMSTFLVWYGALHFAQTIVGAMVGQWLMGRTKELWPLIGRMVVGLVLARLCMTIPHIGWLVKLGVVMWGVGAIALALYGRMQPKVTTSTPFTPAMPPPTTVGGMQPA